MSQDQRGKKDVSTAIMDILSQEAEILDHGKEKLGEIVAKRKELQAERKRLTSQLRNETRKRKRIRMRSQYLSNEDLVEVLAMRKSQKTGEGKSPAKTSSPKGQAKGKQREGKAQQAADAKK